MHIVYAVTTCSEATYKKLFADTPVKPAFQSQKYHRLLIEGLAAGAQVEVVANPPVNRRVLKKAWIRLPREEEGGACYHNLPAVQNPAVKLAVVSVGTFFGTLFRLKRDTAVVVDVLNCTTALAAALAARLGRRPCIGIVTDLPEMLGQGSLYQKLSHKVIGLCTGYVFLTQAMDQRLNPKRKPYVILEGHADIAMAQKVPSLDKKGKDRICLYAGGVSKRYGLDILVEGFRQANLENTRLVIYGPGDYVPELEEIAGTDPRVVYGGMLLSSQIVQKEMEATLLVNPRPTGEEFVKYSFPSKTMEYMASGTPVLTTVLPGMPEAYHPYVYLLEEETAPAMARRLREILSQTDEALFAQGQQARAFILQEKNNVKQAGKLLAMLEQQRK